MIPMTRSMDIFRARWEKRSTTPVMTNDPAKAERTISAEDTWETNRAAKMMVKLTTIFAPEEMPSTKGPAMGLRKKVWSRNPDTDSAPPKIAARSIRGIRMLKMMRLSVEALISVSRAFPPRSRSLPAARRAPPVRRNTSPAGMSTLPVFTFSTSPQASRAVKRAVDSRNRLQTGSLPHKYAAFPAKNGAAPERAVPFCRVPSEPGPAGPTPVLRLKLFSSAKRGKVPEYGRPFFRLFQQVS